MILLRSFLSGHIRIKRTLEYYDAGIGPRVPFGGGFGPTVSANFAVALGDYTTLSTTSSMPTGGLITRAGNATMYDSTGKLTWAPNNQYINSGSATNTARTITTVAGVNYYIWIQTSTGTATIVASGTNTTTFNGSTSGTYTAFTATAGTLTLTPTSNFANITQVVVAQITYETALRSDDNVVTGASAYYGPRFDYDPVTLAAKGLLVEGARTNLLTYSNTFDNAGWNPTTYYATATSTSALAPDGSNTVYKITPSDASNNAHILRRYNLPSFSTSTAYTLSVYAKTAGYNLNLQLYDGVTIAATNFDLTAGTVISTTAGTAKITSIGNGWYRCSITGTTNSSVSVSLADVGLYNGATSFAGSTSLGIYAFGAQLEVGAFATSYIPTVASSVARAAETFTLASYTNRLVESFYIDEQTGGSWSANINASATSPLTISTPTFGWVTSLRPYTNAYAGDIAAPSWIDNSGTTGNRMYYDSTGTLTWAPHNQILQSQTFQVTWAASNATVTDNATTAPDGTTTAANVVVGASTAATTISQTALALAASAYIISVYVKKNVGTRYFQLRYASTGASSDYANFDLDTGAVTAGTYAAANITNAGNGWWRIYMLSTNVAAFTSGPTLTFIPASSSARGASYTGNSTDAVYLWGAQLERVTYQTSPRAYIPTTSAAVYQPRYDYDPSVTPATPRGMLIEESRVNSLTYSEQFNNAAWLRTAMQTFGSGSVIDAIISPDGTLTADKYAPDTTSALHISSQSVSTSATTYTLSIYAKTAGYRIVLFTNNGGVNAARGFDLSNGTTFANTSGYSEPTSYAITSVGNGWYRCSMSFTKTSAVSCSYGLWFNNGTADTFAGDGVSGAYVWGAQLEAGSFPTSYIPTTTASVTRVADVVKLSGSALTTLQGTNFSDVVEFNPMSKTASGPNDMPVAFYINSTARDTGYISTSTGVFSLWNGSVSLSTANAATINATNRLASSASAAGRSIVGNGGTVATDANTMFGGASVTTVSLGVNGTIVFSGWYRALSLYNQRLPDATLKIKSVVGAPL